MIYKNSEIDSNYKYIAEYSDNYIVWVREKTLKSNTTYSAYIQYLDNCYTYIFTDNYKIKNGNKYNINYYYTNNGMYSFLDYADVDYELTTIEVDDDYISSDIKDSNDILNIFLGQILCCICVLWVFKQLSRLFFRGGLW